MSEIKWLEYTDSFYKKWIDKWVYTWDVYSGEYSDLGKVSDYLHKRAYFEKDEAYDIRIAGVDPDLSLFTIVSSIVGQACSTEEDDTYTFEDEGFESIVKEKLWENIDGKGMSYPVLWKDFASRQLVYQYMYVLVEGITKTKDGQGERVQKEASIKLITPDMVLAQGKDWIKVKHIVHRSGELPSEKEKEVKQYTIYSTDGWIRYEEIDGHASQVGEGTYAFYTDNSSTRQKRLPIFLVRLPFHVYIAHYLARKVVTLFNLDSCIDTFVLEGTSTTLVDDADMMTHEAVKDDLNAGEGHVNIEGKAYYIAPPAEPAKMGNDRVEIKRKLLKATALQQFGDAAKMTTATEIRYKSKSGIEAFLSLFVGTIEAAEQEALFLLEQVYFPDNPSKWKKAKVSRSKKFQVLDPTEMLKLILDIVFGASAIPVTDEMVFEAVKTVWEDHLGYELSEEEEGHLREVVQLFNDGKFGSSRNVSVEDEPEFNEL